MGLLFHPTSFYDGVANIYDVITLCMFFMVALTNGVLTARLKVQRNEMIEKERKYSALYKFVKDLSEAKNLDDIIRKSIMQIQNIFGFKSVVFLPEDKDKLQKNHHKASNFSPDEMEWLAAETAFKQKSEAGKGTDSLGGAEALYFPMILGRSIIYVLGVKIEDGYKLSLREKEFLRSFIEEVIPFIEKVLN